MQSTWLDRFSGPPTPAGGSTPSRGYSPAPRRPSHLAPQRTGTGLGLQSNRSNVSLDLSGNTSTVSLASPTKVPNGSALRYEQKPPPNVKDPSVVLRAILGNQKLEGKSDSKKPGIDVSVEELDDDIPFNDLSLQDFILTPPSHVASVPDIDQSHTQRKKLEDFHKSIAESDKVLESVEIYLTNFKAELGQVSAEIESLQQQSIELNGRLENRRQVEKLLGPAVEDVSVSPFAVRAIAEGPIDDNFLKALTEIEARSGILESKKASSEPVKALEDVRPLLDDLNSKAIERIRDFIVAQIKALRSPNVNAQIIQQQKFIPYKDLFSFLTRHHPILADEVGQAYINTMKWYYSSHFTRYQTSLEKLPVNTLNTSDLLGADPTPTKRSTNTKTTPSTPQHDVFSLGKRAEILKSTNSTSIPSYLAEDSKSTHYLEVPFRHFNQALIDNASYEYNITTEIFATSSYQAVTRKTLDILDPTFTIGHNLTKYLVSETTDCFGVLLCVRLTQHFAFELQRRKLPVMDNYINYTNILLWPRLQQIMDLHCESLRKVPVTSTRGASAAFSLVGGGGGGSNTSQASVAPHFITQRFGQFLHGISSLSTEASDDEPLSRSLDRLRTEYQTLMTKLSKGAGDASKRARFLYNNYSLILTIISDTQGKLAEELKEHFGGLMNESKGK